MRHPRQHLCDPPVVGEFDQFGQVVVVGWPEHQPLGDQHRTVYRRTVIREGFLFDNHGYLQSMKKGRWRPISL